MHRSESMSQCSVSVGFMWIQADEYQMLLLGVIVERRVSCRLARYCCQHWLAIVANSHTSTTTNGIDQYPQYCSTFEYECHHRPSISKNTRWPRSNSFYFSLSIGSSRWWCFLRFYARAMEYLSDWHSRQSSVATVGSVGVHHRRGTETQYWSPCLAQSLSCSFKW